MLAPNYDWIEALTEAQKDTLRKRYPDIWETYTTFGYQVTCYDYSQILNEIYVELKSIRLTKSIELPKDKQEAIKKLYDAHKEHCNLNDIVASVPNYHLTVITNSDTILTEVKSNFKDTPILQATNVTEEVLHCDCTCVLLDDIYCAIDAEVLTAFERNAVPFIRRSVLGWYKPHMEIESINLLQHFIDRYKPCKTLR